MRDLREDATKAGSLYALASIGIAASFVERDRNFGQHRI